MGGSVCMSGLLIFPGGWTKTGSWPKDMLTTDLYTPTSAMARLLVAVLAATTASALSTPKRALKVRGGVDIQKLGTALTGSGAGSGAAPGAKRSGRSSSDSLESWCVMGVPGSSSDPKGDAGPQSIPSSSKPACGSFERARVRARDAPRGEESICGLQRPKQLITRVFQRETHQARRDRTWALCR